jgi:DNA-binding PadR family transcriptional regulator
MPLKVFSDKEANLNHLILLTLHSTKVPLTKYEIYKQVHSVRGYRHVESKTVYRRIDALHLEGWILEVGSRPAAVQGESKLF